MRAVRYDRFQGIDGIYIGEVPAPEPAPTDVLVRVVASALNPGALSALTGSAYVPGRDLAGTVAAVGADVEAFAVGDEVLGRLQSWEAHAELVAVPADQLVRKPSDLSWEVAGSLFTTPMAGLGAVNAVQPDLDDLVVISGSSGGVGFTAAQLCRRRGAHVIGLTSQPHEALLREHGIDPVRYGDGEEQRIRDAAGPRAVTAFIDTVGGHYIELALRLGVATHRIDTVVDYAGAARFGVQARGTNDAGGLPALSRLAELAATGALDIPIARTSPFVDVQDAYRALSDRDLHGRVVLRFDGR